MYKVHKLECTACKGRDEGVLFGAGPWLCLRCKKPTLTTEARLNELRGMANAVAQQARTEGEAVAMVAEALSHDLITEGELPQLEQLVFDRMPPKVVGRVLTDEQAAQMRIDSDAARAKSEEATRGMELLTPEVTGRRLR